jgi:hypothetical protein
VLPSKTQRAQRARRRETNTSVSFDSSRKVRRYDAVSARQAARGRLSGFLRLQRAVKSKKMVRGRPSSAPGSRPLHRCDHCMQCRPIGVVAMSATCNDRMDQQDKRAEGRGQKAEGRRQKAEGSRRSRWKGRFVLAWAAESRRFGVRRQKTEAPRLSGSLSQIGAAGVCACVARNAICFRSFVSAMEPFLSEKGRARGIWCKGLW